MKARIVAVLLILAIGAAPGWAASPAYINKIVMHARGDVSLDPMAPAVIAPAPLNLPPFLVTPLMTGVLKIQATTDVMKGKVTIGVWVVPGPAFDRNQVPNELGGVGFPDTGVPISMFVIKIQDVVIGDTGTMMTTVGPQTATPTITFAGKVIDVLVPSPFGDVAGRSAAMSAQFDHVGSDASFSFVGGFVAGSHSTWNMTATGALYLPEAD